MVTTKTVINAPKLFIPRKITPQAHPGYGTDMRAIEVWAKTLEYTTGGGGGTFYASLTGIGETTTPGALTQLGTFHIQTGHSFQARMVGSSADVTIFSHGLTGTADMSLVATATHTATIRIAARSAAKTASVFISAQSSSVGPTHAFVTIFSNWNVDIAATNAVNIHGRTVTIGSTSNTVFIRSNAQITVTATTHLTLTGQLTAIVKSPNRVRLSAPTITLSNLTTSVTTIRIGTSRDKIGFFGHTNPHIRVTVTGSRGGNAALASLLTALGASTSGYGLITNATTP